MVGGRTFTCAAAVTGAGCLENGWLGLLDAALDFTSDQCSAVEVPGYADEDVEELEPVMRA